MSARLSGATVIGEEPVSESWNGSDGVLVECAGRLMGTDCSVRIVADNAEVAHDVALAGYDLAAQLDHEWTRFDAESELSRFNAFAQESPCSIAVSERLALLIEAMLWAFDLSDGLVDAAVLPAVIAAGYDCDYDNLQHQSSGSRRPHPTAGGQARATMKDVSLQGNVVAVQVPLSLDSGGIGKGLAADLVAESCLRVGVSGVLVNLGGDIRTFGRDQNGMEWLINIADERDLGGPPVGTWRIGGGAVATSSITRRRLPGGHHLIDPRTGRPSRTDVVAATVNAPTAGQAECTAKTAIILGLARGLEFISDAGLGAVVTSAGGSHFNLPRKFAC